MPLMEFAEFDRRPIVVAIAGPNGAGKTTFFHAHLASAGLRFVNADVLAAELAVGPYEAARLADALRRALVERGESFVFETVFSDPVGDKVAFLEEAAGAATSSCCVTSASPAPISRRSAWQCASRRAVMMSPTTSSRRGFPGRSPISGPPSCGCLMS